jgi:ABC-2 type transport system permease protein
LRAETIPADYQFDSGVAPRPVGFGHALISEWIKVSTLRSSYVTLALALGLSVATTALGSLAIGNAGDQWPAGLDPDTFSMVGNVFALIIFSVFGVMVVSREYASGMIRLTLAATPRRSHILFAKLVVVTAITLPLGLLTTVAMLLVGQAILAAHGLSVSGLGDSDVRLLVLGLGAVMPYFPIVGLCLGVLFRSTAAAISTVLGLLWLPLIFGEVLPMWWRENVISLLPGTALDSLTIAHVVDSPTHVTPVLGALIAGLWLAAFVGAAFMAMKFRDA